jgi:hypothetical protein
LAKSLIDPVCKVTGTAAGRGDDAKNAKKPRLTTGAKRLLRGVMRFEGGVDFLKQTFRKGV